MAGGPCAIEHAGGVVLDDLGENAGEQLVAAVPDPRDVAVCGWKPVDSPSVGGHDALHPETDAQHRDRACA